MMMLSDLMKRLFHLAWPSSTAIVGTHVYRHADGRSVVTCVCSLKAVRGVNERRGSALVTSARRHLIMTVIVSSWPRDWSRHSAGRLQRQLTHAMKPPLAEFP